MQANMVAYAMHMEDEQKWSKNVENEKNMCMSIECAPLSTNAIIFFGAWVELSRARHIYRARAGGKNIAEKMASLPSLVAIIQSLCMFLCHLEITNRFVVFARERKQPTTTSLITLAPTAISLPTLRMWPINRFFFGECKWLSSPDDVLGYNCMAVLSILIADNGLVSF